GRLDEAVEVLRLRRSGEWVETVAHDAEVGRRSLVYQRTGGGLDKHALARIYDGPVAVVVNTVLVRRDKEVNRRSGIPLPVLVADVIVLDAVLQLDVSGQDVRQARRVLRVLVVGVGDEARAPGEPGRRRVSRHPCRASKQREEVAELLPAVAHAVLVEVRRL